MSKNIASGSFVLNVDAVYKSTYNDLLTNYAPTAANGEIVFATDTKVYYGIKDGALTPLGGIDTTQPLALDVNSTSTALRVTQTGTGNALLIEDSSNPDATPFVVDTVGQVGIGTTTPTSPVQVVSSKTDPSSALNNISSELTKTLTVSNSTNPTYGIYSKINAVIPSGVSSGSGATVEGIRIDAAVSGNEGTIGTIKGLDIRPGHATGSTGTASSVFGVTIAPQANSGTISNFYAYYTGSPAGSAITNYYGFYQFGTTAKNVLQGTLAVGPAGINETKFQILQQKTNADSYGAIAAYVQNTQTYSTAQANDIIGLKLNTTLTSVGSVNSTGINVNFENKVTMSSGGVIDVVYGTKTDILAGSAGSLTNAYGYYIRHSGTKPTTNQYGLYIDSPSSAVSITNEYGIYQDSNTAKNYLNGGLGIGTTGSTGALTLANTKHIEIKPSILSFISGDTTITPSTAGAIGITGGITQINDIAAGSDGQLLTLINRTGANITIKDESAALGTASGRIYTGTGADYTFPSNGALNVIYDATMSRWQLVGTQASTGGGSGLVEVFNALVVNTSGSSSVTGALYFKAPKAFTINKTVIQIFEKGSVSSGTLVVDVLKNTTPNSVGMTSIFSTTPSISYVSASDYATSTGTLNPSNVAVGDGDWIRLDIASMPTGVSRVFVQVYGQ